MYKRFIKKRQSFCPKIERFCQEEIEVWSKIYKGFAKMQRIDQKYMKDLLRKDRVFAKKQKSFANRLRFCQKYIEVLLRDKDLVKGKEKGGYVEPE